ncbi:acyl-CoA thioesterase [Sphingomonas sp. HHU CXW]|uniref:Acyl-CoA thioesterase n=1 Tax=Sphingomonas hominis TaxID=2741495 RepID=A0ABX2JG24_9SPHN|nr:thioesterase family protein [Sphingomonas hominis]NTS64669.1 acyl-CoA thioesterase [Sphingomonas hominis]
MSRPGFAFSTRFKVRYAEIDGQKIVFNSRYLEYADVAVTEFWAWTGIAEALGDEWRHTEFNVRRAELDYLSSFRLGDEVQAFVRIERLGTTSITKRFELVNPATGTLCCAITMVSVNVDLASGRPVPLSPAIRAHLEQLPSA